MKLFIFNDGKQKNQEPLTHPSVVVPCKAEYEEKKSNRILDYQLMHLHS